MKMALGISECGSKDRRKEKSPIERGRRKIGEVRSRDEGSIKSPAYSPRRREGQMDIRHTRPISVSENRGSRLGRYIFGKVRDFVL